MARELDEVYADRNLLVQLAARIAHEAGYPAWIGFDSKEPDWPVVFIELPTGQVSFHLPKHELVVELPRGGDDWDGHTSTQKRERLRQFLQTPPSA